MSKEIPKQARKSGEWFLKKLEKGLVAWMVPKVPKWLETYHLTTMTLGWMGLAVLSGYLAKQNLNYLWLMSLAVVGQYITDLLDGAVGRARETGLVKWGFYFDHILDFGFLCAILLGYWFITPSQYHYVLMATLMMSAAYFVHTILFFGATGEFEIASMGIGPTEIRLVFVVVNTMLALFDKVVLVNLLWAYFWINAGYLIWTVYRTQKRLWQMDMEKKLEAGKNQG